MNTCHYSKGSKHELCDHQEYCIFNEKRTLLEKSITKLENKITSLQQTVALMDSDDIYFTINIYKKTLKKLRISIDELNRLKEYKEHIKRGDGYGYTNDN